MSWILTVLIQMFIVCCPEIVMMFMFICICSFMQNDNNASNSSLDEANRRGSLKHSASLAIERQGGTLKPHQSVRLKKRLSMYSSSHSRINFGDANDDVHLCILCLRAIMNHQV